MATGYTSSLALFAKPPTDIGVDNISYMDYKPVNSISDGSAIEFNISGNTANYIDFKKCRLKVKMRIVSSDNTLLTGSKDDVGLCNLPMSTLWSNIDVSFSQTPVVSMGMGHYPYISMLNLLCNSSEEVSESHLQSQLFFKDVNDMDQNSITSGSNIGYVRRCGYTQNSKIVDLEGPLNLGIFSQDRYMLNGIDIGIKLTPSSNAFRMMCVEDGSNYKIEIVDICFSCAMIKCSPGIIIGHSKALENSPALYPFNKSILKTYNISAGSYGISIENLFLSNTPQKIVLAMVSADSFSGSYKKNPFNFRHFGLNHCALYVDYIQVPSNGIKLDFANDQYLSGYETLFGNSSENKGSIISRNDYKNGYSLIVINLNENFSGEYLAQSKQSNSRLELKFKDALNTSVTLIVCGSFQSMIEIDKSRNVSLK